jgi:hypothetical protein
MTWRKCRENKNIKIYLNNTALKHVNYLDKEESKLTLKKYNLCSREMHRINILTQKLNWGLNNDELEIIYTEAILPLLLYGAPVWYMEMHKLSNNK